MVAQVEKVPIYMRDGACLSWVFNMLDAIAYLEGEVWDRGPVRLGHD